MSKRKQPTPNTHLGEVHWYSDMFYGNLLWVCQGMLGVHDPQGKCERFLNTDMYTVSDLWGFFHETVLPNGNIALELTTDNMYCTTALCVIETTLLAEEEVNDQDFLNLIEDFKEHVSKLPPAKCGDGALIVDPDQPGYYEESNQRWLKRVLKLNNEFNTALLAAEEQLRSEGTTVVRATGSVDDDDVPF